MAKTPLVFLMWFASVAFAGEEEVVILKGPSGYSIASEVAKDSGFRVQKGLALSSQQLSLILEKGESVPLDSTRRFLGWNTYHTHILYEVVSTREAVLGGAVIREVKKEKVAKGEMFNPFLALSILYIPAMLYVYRYLNKKNLPTTFAAAAAAAFAFAAVVAFAAVAAFAAVVAFAAVAAAFAAVIVGNDKKWALIGIVAMVIASVSMHFLF